MRDSGQKKHNNQQVDQFNSDHLSTQSRGSNFQIQRNQTLSQWEQSNEKTFKSDDKIIKGQTANYGPDSENLVEQQNFKNDIPPKDTNGKIHIIFFIWGIGVLLPWNAILNVFDFFGYEMNGHDPVFIFPFAVNILLFVTQVLMIVYGNKLSERFKLQVGFLLACIIIIILPIFSNYLDDDPAFWSVFFILIFFGIINGLIQGSVFGLASIMPPKYMSAVMFGNGISGIFMSLLKALLVSVLPTDSQHQSNYFNQALIYFAFAAFILITCSILYQNVYNSQFFLYYKMRSVQKHGQQNGSQKLYTDDDNQNQSTIDDVNNEQTFQDFLIQFKINFKKAWKVLFSMIWVFTVTLAIFPGAFFQSKFNFLSEDQNNVWQPIIINILFNFFDTVGRYVGGVLHMKPYQVFLWIQIRLIFVFTTIGIAKNWKPSIIFDQDWFIILNVSLCALSNGYLSTQCAILAPKYVDEDQREQIGIFNSLSLAFGILSGATLAIPMGKIL